MTLTKTWIARGLASAALLATLTVTPARAPSQAQASARRPNVIVILADDLGYGDVGANGGKRVPTPNIDSLARTGIRFTDGYVTAAVCAPSRAGLLTGRHQSRFGFEFNPVGRNESLGPPLTETTIAQVMNRAGYSTGMVGKWHIGQAAGFHPMDRGFDEYFGVLAGATAYLPKLGASDEAAPTAGDDKLTRTNLPIYRGRDKVEAPGYLTHVFTDEAVAFVDRHAQQPFFLYLAYNAPHTPLQASAKYLDRFRSIQNPDRRVYSAMLSALDDGVGRLLAELDRKGLRDNTMVIFLSDNGCPNYIRGACTNGPLSGFKAYPWEGGIRVPYIVSWPGGLKPGVYRNPVSSLDILPTAAGLAGVKATGAEGVNLLPYLRGRKGGLPNETLFWRMGPNHAVRAGRWKLLVVNKSDTVENINEVVGSPVPDGVKAEVSPLGQWRLLYDLNADPGEERDLAAQHPEIAKRLEAQFRDWNRKNVEPMFTSRRQFRSEVNGHKAQLYN